MTKKEGEDNMKKISKRAFFILLTFIMVFACVPLSAVNLGSENQSIVALSANHTHKKVTTLKKATLSKNGSKIVSCSSCKKTLSKSSIAKISSVKLAKSTFTYTGKAIKPSLIVKDSNGKTLKFKTDYTVTYKNNKSPGKASATVTFKGNYSGKKTLSFSIIPKLTVKKTSSSLSFSWTKIPNAVSHRVALYDGKKLIKAFDTSKTSAKFTKLKPKKSYKFVIKAYDKKDKLLTSAECTGKTEAYADYSKVKIGFILLHDKNSTYDNNFIVAIKNACKKLGVKYVIETNVPEDSTCYDSAVNLVKKGCNIVFANSFGHEEYIMNAAKKYPKVEFCHASGIRAHTSGLKNYHNAYAATYEGRYLTGVAAGLKIKEMIDSGKIKKSQAKIGYVAAFDYAEVVSDYTAFYLGAKSIVPTVKMEVKFTKSWFDLALEKSAANSLIKRGCVLISQHADSLGAPLACSKANVPNVGFNVNYAGEYPKTSIVTSKINWEPYFEYIITQKATGKSIKTDWTGNLKTGSVELSKVNEKAAAKGTSAKIKKVESDLKSGKIHVFDTNKFTVSGKKLNSYLADVDFDYEFEKDTPVVFNGYFHESEMRSAPYFDLRIDGIKLLNN